MEIYIEPSARDYISKKNPQKAITLGVGKRDAAHCGCGVGAGVYPSVKLGVSPFDVEDYDKVTVDGIDVFFPNSVANVFRTVTVKLEGVFFYRQLLAMSS
ncbi:MAG TPA: CC/Se motif family (seleno)protein [Selenomonadales bacterium]|nr:CC/Se motif family (seleno)protein [Selenomonadales bacterium]